MAGGHSGWMLLETPRQSWLPGIRRHTRPIEAVSTTLSSMVGRTRPTSRDPVVVYTRPPSASSISVALHAGSGVTGTLMVCAISDAERISCRCWPSAMADKSAEGAELDSGGTSQNGRNARVPENADWCQMQLTVLARRAELESSGFRVQGSGLGNLVAYRCRVQPKPQPQPQPQPKPLGPRL